jgi:hypothetical protein
MPAIACGSLRGIFAIVRGRDFSFDQLRARLRCTKCGALAKAKTILSSRATQDITAAYPKHFGGA